MSLFYYHDKLKNLEHLLKAYGFGGMDAGYQAGGNDKYQGREQEHHDINHHNKDPVEVDGHGVEIVVLRIKGYQPRVFLYSTQSQAYDIAPKHSLAHDKQCKTQEDASHRTVIGPQSLEYTYELCTLEDEDEQT